MKRVGHRSKVRRALGRRYFTAKRHLTWQLSKTGFATRQKETPLDFEVFEHSSVLLRKLKDVDMWLQHNKVTNLGLAIRPMRNLIIAPKETFSFWYLVKKPSKRRGYKQGLVLENGKIGAGYGGGLCQLGNLIYWMVLHTELTVVERYRHAYDVFPDVNRKLPFGSGATVAYNYIDLQFRNDTDQLYQLKLQLNDRRLLGEIRCERRPAHRYQVYEAKHHIEGPSWQGYRRVNELRRRICYWDSGQPLGDELVTENNALMMYAPLLE